MKISYFLNSFLFLFLSFNYYSQYNERQLKEIDSLKLVVETSNVDSNIAESLLYLSEILYLENIDTLTYYAKIAIEIADSNIIALKNKEDINVYKSLKASALNNIGYAYSYGDKSNETITYYLESLELRKEINEQESLGSSYNNLAYIYQNQGNIPKAIDFYLLSLSIQKKRKDKDGEANTLLNLGSLYQYQKELERAKDCYNKALKLDNDVISAYSLSNLGTLSDSKSEALIFYKKSLVLFNKVNDRAGIALANENIGTNFFDLKKYDSALYYLDKAHFFYIESDRIKAIARINLEKAKVFVKQGKSISKANQIVGNSLKTAYKVNDIDLILKCSNFLYKTNKQIKNFSRSLEMHEVYLKYNDSLINSKNQKDIFQKKFEYDYKGKVFQDSIRHLEQEKINRVENEKKIALGEAKQENQIIIIISISIILILIVAFLLFVYRRLRITSNQKNIIEKQKDAVNNQKEIIEHQHKEISDSINYAEAIQKSVLPSSNIQNIREDSFVLFIPKDKVSGDFFWLEEKEELQYFIAADCTGHGVPGAFISMIGTILLNEVHNSKNIQRPDLILNELRRLVILTLTNSQGKTMKDGMDIAIGVLDKKTNLLQFSGANNPVWIVSKDNFKIANNVELHPNLSSGELNLFEVKGDKMPIGLFDTQNLYQLNTIQLAKGDSFYLFSDGYADQFGGPRGKKYKYKPFKELLLGFDSKSGTEKKEILMNDHINWKGDLEQVDDICVIGVKV